jgi:hypothetical protein
MVSDRQSILFSSADTYKTLSRAVRRGEAVRLGTGVYSTDTTSPPEILVRREWRTIAGGAFPHATITDRSAPNAGPVDGVLYLVHDAPARSLVLPGLTISARRGAPPQSDDVALPGGLHQASFARGLVENAIPSRARTTGVARRLSRAELGDWIDRAARFSSASELGRVRDRVRSLAPLLGVTAQAARAVDDLIGAALGTRDAPKGSRALHQRSIGLPYDTQRVERFDLLIDALRSAAPQNRPAAPLSPSTLPFYEAYFSNYIEGTEFTVEEAEAIIYEGRVPEGRPADAHDVQATYELVSDLEEMHRTAADLTEFIDLLTHRHASFMAGRPEKRPGLFKELPNRAGSTLFVHPDLVRGTLLEGFARLDELDSAWERAVYVHYLVAAVHPFDDGNGRLARIMMNSELDRRGQSRLIIPSVYRDDYLGALRRLDRADDPSVLVDALRYAHDWTASIDFTDAATVREQLEVTHAFAPADGSERLTLPLTRHFLR